MDSDKPEPFSGLDGAVAVVDVDVDVEKCGAGFHWGDDCQAVVAVVAVGVVGFPGAVVD